ncbi:DUF6328 family protein [Nocardia sp. NPDC004722]
MCFGFRALRDQVPAAGVAAQGYAIAGLALLGVALTGVAVLIFDTVAGPVPAGVAGAFFGLFFAAVWVLHPWRQRRP